MIEVISTEGGEGEDGTDNSAHFFCLGYQTTAAGWLLGVFKRANYSDQGFTYINPDLEASY